MKLIKEILEKDIIQDSKSAKGIKYSIRRAARAILFKKDTIAVLYVAKHNYHKLPGGGVEEEENIKEALYREILEETGCKSKIEDDLGVTLQFKDALGILQIDYIFSAVVTEESDKFEFTEKEKSEGFVLEWYSIKELEEIFSKDNPKDYHGKFIVKRDKAIIAWAFLNRETTLGLEKHLQNT